MRRTRDVNDLWRAGELPADPFEGGRPMRANGTVAPASPWDALQPLPGAWLTVEPRPRLWLVKDLLPRGKVGILAGAGGVGKTYAAIDLALSVAGFRPWFGDGQARDTDGNEWAPDAFRGFVVEGEGARGRVALFLGEEDVEEAQRRIWRIAKAKGMLGADARRRLGEWVRVASLAGKTNLALTRAEDDGGVETHELRELRDRLERDAGPKGWALIVLDPLSRFAGPDVETDNAAATRLIQAVESLAKVPGNPTVIVCHHTTKGARRDGTTDATSIRGSSAIVDGARWAATLTGTEGDETGELVTFTLAKSNYSAQHPPTILARGYGGALRPAKEAELRALEEAKAASGAKGSAPGSSVREVAESIRQGERDHELGELAKDRRAGVRNAVDARRRALRKRDDCD